MTTATASPRALLVPRVDIIEGPEKVELKAELPGVPKDGVELEIKNGELTLIGHRSNGASEGEYRLQERRYGDFRRVFSLSRAIDTKNVEARMENGVLTIVLPKAENVKPRKISIN